jgi:glutamate dehydrogenase
MYRLGQETSAPATEIAAAHFAAWEIYDLESLVQEVNRQDGLLPIDLQMSIHLGCRQVAERVTRLLLLNRPNPFSTSDAIVELAGPVQDAMGHLGDYLVGGDRQNYDTTVEKLTSAEASPELARRAAGLPVGSVAIDIVTVADQTGLPVPIIAATYFTAGEDLGLNWLRDRILALPRDTRWSSQARLTLRTDLYADHRQITAQVIETAQLNSDIDDREPAALAGGIVQRWADRHRREVDAYRQTMVAIRATATPDLTTLLVAAREVRNLIARTR